MSKFLNKFVATMVVLSVVSVTACQTTYQNDQRYLAGKRNFQQQNYQAAFNQLLPVAKQGNADAQYAVGYMYYYGKGVVENHGQAQYWMSRAAKQGQPAARQAMKMIQANNR